MKITLGYEMTSLLEDIVFPKQRIEKKNELMAICMKVCRELTITSPMEISIIKNSNMVLKLDKMCRLFFFHDTKYMSISVPLSFTYSIEGNLQFYFRQIRIDSEMWSKLIERVNNPADEWMDEDWFFDYTLSTDKFTRDFETVYDNFSQADYGYVRFDHDIKAYTNAKKQGRQYHHPLHHLDIHLSNEATFKVGLTNKISKMQFIDIMDNQQPRWYFTHHRTIVSGQVKELKLPR